MPGGTSALFLCPSSETPPAFSPQIHFLSPQARRRFHAAFASCSTSMLILSNLVFLGGSQVGKIYWNRIFIQGKLPDNAVFGQFLVFHVCCCHIPCGTSVWCSRRRSLFCSWYVTHKIPTRNNSPCLAITFRGPYVDVPLVYYMRHLTLKGIIPALPNSAVAFY